MVGKIIPDYIKRNKITSKHDLFFHLVDLLSFWNIYYTADLVLKVCFNIVGETSSINNEDQRSIGHVKEPEFAEGNCYFLYLEHVKFMTLKYPSWLLEHSGMI